MKSILILALSASAFLFASCNTLAGAGQDMQRGGAAVTDAARDVAR